MRYLIDNFAEVMAMTRTHLVLAMVPLLLGLLLAVPIGALVRGTRWARRLAITLSSVAYTIPSLALFVIIPPLLGISMIDPLNVIIALTVYSTALLVIAVPMALDTVPAEVISAADAIGFGGLRRTVTVDMPLALPVFTASLRVVVVTNIAMVSVGALIGVGGLGKLFTQGYQRDYPDQIVAGIIVTLVLALIFDRLVFLLGALATPWTRAHASGTRS
ncbi:ABC transporter permease [Nocardia alba]|uniref:Osmoprotectant transport system permease protein n=1 Tax=Nocardia alba TaxID=225051 RepID=A0A4R1FXF3_9NOCA|nr:ABC transporter permease [Nocardia alba]TCJ99763.1 osmoprotectant transport system permease protein [Nocardia alba]